MLDHGAIRLRRPFMGCEFELVLCGRDRCHLVDAATEAFDEIAKLERQMSVFIPTSEICCLNANASRESVRVEPRLYELLARTRVLAEETEAAFDVTSGALVRLWNSSDGRLPSPDQIAQALESVGFSGIQLCDEEHTIRYTRPGIELNLGAVGKGYAVDRTVELLAERGVSNALVSAGSSTVYAMGTPPEDDSWAIGISDPRGNGERLTTVRLRDEALSVSGSHERFVEIEGRKYGHIIDPRTGWPANGPLLACAIALDATTSDALSTAFFTLGIDGTLDYCKSPREADFLIVLQAEPDEELKIVCSHKFKSVEVMTYE